MDPRLENFIPNGTILYLWCVLTVFPLHCQHIEDSPAFTIAVIHLLTFKYLDGKQTDGIPQSYVTTASSIMANLFGASLTAALAIAFTQWLWRLMRRTPTKVATIELLFTIRTNPFLLFRPAVIRCTPVLFLCALLTWSIYIATSLPPGALTVQLSERTYFQMVRVPTFNASEV